MPTSSLSFNIKKKKNMAMVSGNRNGKKQENFEEFFEKWKDEQQYHLNDLITASNDSQHLQTDQLSSSLPGLVDRVIAHYEKLYSTKSEWAKTDVLQLLSPPWFTQLEDAFLWIGGWRPTTAFHLLLSKSSLQFEASFADLLKGVEMEDLSNLSNEQMEQVDQLQMSTVREEREISEKLAKQQGRVADMEMVELSHKGEGESSRIESAIKSKEEGLEIILQRADDLRMKVLRGIVGILTRVQAVHFLIAAGELLRKMHAWGKKKEETQGGKRTILLMTDDN